MTIKTADQPYLVQEVIRALQNQRDIHIHKIVIYGAMSGQDRDAGLEIILDPADPEAVQVTFDQKHGLLESEVKRRKNKLIVLLLDTADEVVKDISTAEANHEKSDF